jgi:hypothetical protein
MPGAETSRAEGGGMSTPLELLDRLDGATIGRLGITKSTVCNEPWLTVYDRENNGELAEFDEQLTLRPEELLALCRVVTACANAPAESRVANNKPT